MSNRESADLDLDQNLRCAACGDGFVFTAGEQELYRLRGITAQPRHCPSCARGGVHLANPRRGT
jgi:ribosomal protein S27AE